MNNLPKLTLFLFLIIMHAALIAQDTIYYYNDKNESVSREEAYWYREVKFTSTDRSTCTGTERFADGKLRRTAGAYIIEGQSFLPNDTFTNYYSNGNIESSGRYTCNNKHTPRGKRIGFWTDYYKEGGKECEMLYLDSMENYDLLQKQVINYWDSAGRQTLVNGNGTRYIPEYARAMGAEEKYDYKFIGNYKNGWLNGPLTGWYGSGNVYCREEYKNGKLVNGLSYDTSGHTYNYVERQKKPEFPGGDAALIKFLQANVKYPKPDRDNDVQGKVLLRFVVNAAGHVTEVKIVKSVSPGLDAEAKRVVELLPDFVPGELRGQSVPVYFNLPVVFRLQ